MSAAEIHERARAAAITQPQPAGRVNAMSVDVEDYFQVQAFADRLPRVGWGAIPRRVEANIDWLLDLFAENGGRATFFTLGWVAERHPAMLRRIAAAGHEIASHGYDHRRVDELAPEMFRSDICRTKGIIEDITALPVVGYRAPTFSIGAGQEWAYEILEEEGYCYSSSVYPIRHDLYGASNAPRTPFTVGHDRFWEIPLTTRRFCGQNIPCAGGGYFRLLPYWLSRLNLRHLNAANGPPCVFYFHPWEIDPDQPRVQGISARARFRHYTNLGAMRARLRRLMRDFRWERIDKTFADYIAAPLAAAEPGATSTHW